MWVIVSLNPEVRVSGCGWWEEEELRWVDNEEAWMSQGYGPIFIVPLVFVIGSGNVDDAVRSTVRGMSWEGLVSIGT